MSDNNEYPYEIPSNLFDEWDNPNWENWYPHPAYQTISSINELNRHSSALNVLKKQAWLQAAAQHPECMYGNEGERSSPPFSEKETPDIVFRFMSLRDELYDIEDARMKIWAACRGLVYQGKPCHEDKTFCTELYNLQIEVPGTSCTCSESLFYDYCTDIPFLHCNHAMVNRILRHQLEVESVFEKALDVISRDGMDENYWKAQGWRGNHKYFVNQMRTARAVLADTPLRIPGLVSQGAQ